MVRALEHRGEVMPPAIPIATYRLQLTSQFGFDRAAELVPYLKNLGISHLYVSPFLKARSGSTHGYDVIDHNELNPELGGEGAVRRLRRRTWVSSLILYRTIWGFTMPTTHGGSTSWSGGRDRLMRTTLTSTGRCSRIDHPAAC